MPPKAPKNTRRFNNYDGPTAMMMENRGGVDRVDGDGPNRDGAATGVGARVAADTTARATHP